MYSAAAVCACFRTCIEKEFTSYPWAHLDIAPTEADDKRGPYQPKGATGFGVRTLVEFLRTRSVSFCKQETLALSLEDEERALCSCQDPAPAARPVQSERREPERRRSPFLAQTIRHR